MARMMIAGNWKMHHGPMETSEFIENLKEKYDEAPAVEAVICPPFVSLPTLVEAAPRWLKIGAQNVFYEESGAFTGEISPKMLAEIGVDYVIVGHSERRHIFKEGDDDVNQKTCVVLKYGLCPIICVGETQEERENGITKAVIDRQVRTALSEVALDTLKQVVFAYEPVWAIGTGKAATAEDAEQACRQIKEILKELGGQDKSEEIPILYGGSVKPENLAEFIKKDNIDGALVGGKSLQAKAFCQLIQVAVENNEAEAQ